LYLKAEIPVNNKAVYLKNTQEEGRHNITSSDKTSFVFIAVSQKSGTPLADKWRKYKSDIQNGNYMQELQFSLIPSDSFPSAALSLVGSSLTPSTSTTPFTISYL
jgi:hypothetical protein